MAVSVGASVGRRRANVLHSYDDRVTDADFTQCRRTIMRYNSSLIGSSAARSCAPVERCEFNRRQVEVPACVCLCVCVCVRRRINSSHFCRRDDERGSRCRREPMARGHTRDRGCFRLKT